MQMTVSATEARIHFGEIIQDAVLHQQPIVVEKLGNPKLSFWRTTFTNNWQEVSRRTGRQSWQKSTLSWMPTLQEGNCLAP